MTITKIMHYKSETCLTGIYHNYLFKSIISQLHEPKKKKKSKRNGKHLGYSTNYLLANQTSLVVRRVFNQWKDRLYWEVSVHLQRIGRDGGLDRAAHREPCEQHLALSQMSIYFHTPLPSHRPFREKKKDVVILFDVYSRKSIKKIMTRNCRALRFSQFEAIS